MFDYRNLSKDAFLIRNSDQINALIAKVNSQMAAEYGAQLQPLTQYDLWLVFMAEAAIDNHGHIDVNGEHSNGERGVLPLPSNIRFWNGSSAPDPRKPQPFDVNFTQYAIYLAQLKNKVVRQRNGRILYPDIFRYPGIDGHPVRTAKALAGVVHGYFFSGNYQTPPPDDDLLAGYANDASVADLLRHTTYVHAGESILENRQSNLDAAAALVIAQSDANTRTASVRHTSNDDGRYVLSNTPPSQFDTGTLRLDVDGDTATGHFSIALERGFPRQKSHVIAKVSKSHVSGNTRVLEGVLIYDLGDRWLTRSDTLRLTLDYDGHAGLHVLRDSVVIWDIGFSKESAFFDQIEFEVDLVDNAGHVVDVYDTASHPNRPATLPFAAVSIERAFTDAGFDVAMSTQQSVIPIQNSGTAAPWSDMELHNAMQKFWSKYDDRAQWGMWVIYAARHDMGRDLGGVMFDNIGRNHRQGTAIFTDSFIADPPDGEMHPDAWRKRMQIWTTIHEIGHGFNLAHSWAKTNGAPFPLSAQNEPEARSFMNYPARVAGGEDAFFNDFEYRFSSKELLFMRHAPRDFVRMGGSAWLNDHGLREVPDHPDQPFRLDLRPNRDQNLFSFMEPVHLELKLTNTSVETQTVPNDILEEGHHLAFAIARDGANGARRHRPFKTACYAQTNHDVAPGQSLYMTHFVGASAGGWLIDEPGFYTIQAAINLRGITVLSNVLRIYVCPEADNEAHRIAPDFFDEDVARVLAFQGAPTLTKANDTLQQVAEALPDSAVAQHARLGLANPKMRSFKTLSSGTDGKPMKVKSESPNLTRALEMGQAFTADHASATAQTLGHIQYRSSMERLAGALADAGDFDRAVEIQAGLVATLEDRKVLPAVIDDSQSTLSNYQKAQSDAPAKSAARGRKTASSPKKAATKK